MKTYKGLTVIEDNQGSIVKAKNFTDWRNQEVYKVEYVEVHGVPYMVLTDKDGLVTDPQNILKAIEGNEELTNDVNKI